MTVKINQLNEQVNDSDADFNIEQLKKENNQLRHLVNKYHESKSANKISDDIKVKKVDMYLLCRVWLYNNMC